jgi:phage tail sheath protein FI
MATTYKTPGVYIEEISLFPPSVAAVETAIPAFIGYTEKAAWGEQNLNLTPTRITSLLDYVTYFGGPVKEGESITVTINETTDGKGKVIQREVKSGIGNDRSPHNMYYAVQAFYANGGGPAYIVSVGNTAEAAGVISDTELTKGIDTLNKEDEVTLFVIPEVASLGADKVASVMSVALDQAAKLQDRFAIIDVPDAPADTVFNVAKKFRDQTLPNLKYGAAYYPNVKTTFNYAYDEDKVKVVVVTDGVSADKKLKDLNPANLIQYNLAKAAIDNIEMELPPSPLVAGIYANVDSNRGVWKAPANEPLRQVIRPSRKITHEEQEGLNVDTSGKSINAIRTFTGKGTLIWGARTLDGNSNEWRYVSVRRFFNFAEESIKKGTEQFVFEPNDANTWAKVRSMIENFLTLQWRAGALAGAVPEDAFFVKVGLGSTMTALDILEGRMNVEIGMAVVRPAEFIILKFSHKMQES